MAKEGMKLTSHYAAPVCSPSRSAMMTGCYPKRVLPIPGVLFPASAVGLNPGGGHRGRVLKEQGYATGCIGKWHLGDQPEFLPTAQGFDSYLGIPYSNDMGPPAEGSKSNPASRCPNPNAKAKKAKTPRAITTRNRPQRQHPAAAAHARRRQRRRTRQGRRNSTP
jgi:arylsulfatase A